MKKLIVLILLFSTSAQAMIGGENVYVMGRGAGNMIAGGLAGLGGFLALNVWNKHQQAAQEERDRIQAANQIVVPHTFGNGGCMGPSRTPHEDYYGPQLPRDRLFRPNGWQSWEEHDRDIAEEHKKVEEVDQTLHDLNPQTEKRFIAKSLGLIAAQQANESLKHNPNYSMDSIHPEAYEDAQFLRRTAEELLDIGVGFDPVSGFGRSAYELATGRNLITGVNLNDFERSMAFLGVVSAGTSTSGQAAGRAFAKLIQNAGKLLHDPARIAKIIDTAAKAADHLGVPLLRSLPKHHRILDIIEANAHNQTMIDKGWSAGYDAGSKIIHFELTERSKFVRLFTASNPKSNPLGDWVMRKSAVVGLTAAELQKKFGLTHLPENVAVLTIPKGTQMYRGNIGDILVKGEHFGQVGTIQFEIRKFPAGGYMEMLDSIYIGAGQTVKFK